MLIILIFISVIPCISYSQKQSHEKVIIDTIYVKGNKKTDIDVILNNILFKPGDTINFRELKSKIEYSEQNLKDLQIFSGVGITYKIPKTKIIPEIKVTVNVRERWTLIMYPLYSYDNVKLGTYQLNLMEDNFFGRGFPGEFFLSYNKYDINGFMKFTNVPLFRNRLLISPDFYYYKYKDLVYENGDKLYESDILSYGANINLQKHFLNKQITFESTNHIGQNKHSDVVNIINKNTFNESNWREGVGLKIGRINSDMASLCGGNFHLWFEIAPLHLSEYKIELSKKNFYKVWGNNLFGLRVNSFYYSLKEKLYTSEQIRGILQGEERGNLGFYSNFEYRQYLLHINYPTELDIYMPVFIDLGNAVTTYDKRSGSKLCYTAGIGTLFYINIVGGALQFNFGINIPQYAETRNLRQSLYFSVSTGEFFFCSEKCNYSEK